jgi:uncharacterized membrane protein YecN with MAPEG domain
MMITSLYAGLLGLWYLVLSLRVVRRRINGISLGDGGDKSLFRAMRGHGNFAEYVPLLLVMLGVLELGGHLPAWLLHLLGLTLLASRLLHGYALSFTAEFRFGRFYGALLTFILLLLMAVLCLWQGVMHGR